MIVHVLIDIAQETRGDDAHDSKRNADQIDVPIALGIRLLPRRDHDCLRGRVARYARDQLEFVGQGRAGEQDGFADIRHVRDSEFDDHGPADVFGGVGNKFMDEDVIIGCVANAAADHADCESESGYGGDEILSIAD